MAKRAAKIIAAHLGRTISICVELTGLGAGQVGRVLDKEPVREIKAEALRQQSEG